MGNRYAALAGLLLVSGPGCGLAHAQRGGDRIRVDYTVEVRDTSVTLFHVTATFRNLRQNTLELSLPVWTPGWYTLENYGKNILRFVVTDSSGARLRGPRSRPQTWTVDTRGKERVTVEFDYQANVLALNQAKITPRFAFFTGTQLFLEPIGHRNAEITVRFRAPPGWRIASALDGTSDPAVYTAQDYDALVDSPTVLGSFDVEHFEVAGKPHQFVATPAGGFHADSMRQYAGRVASLMRAQADIFGGLPYSKYVIFYFKDAAESNAAGALEHSNSYVAVGKSSLDAIPGAAAHEFFHTWNVKRIRPTEMWPYDYTRPRATPSLWLAEGVTHYYAGLTLYRAGFVSDSLLLANLAGEMSRLESNEARHYMSPTDASVSTWLGYDTPQAFPISYYIQGQILGALLDLSIIHDTRGRHGLDDVMRALYDGFYLRGRGYRAADVGAAASAIAGRDYGDFFDRYVAGVEVPPYDSILQYAGYRTERSDRVVGVLGAFSIETPEGRNVRVAPRGSPAAVAGIRRDDVIVSADGVPIAQAGLTGPGGQFVLGGAGRRVTYAVMRAGAELLIPVTLGRREEVHFTIHTDPSATAEQLAVRRYWLRRTSIHPSP